MFQESQLERYRKVYDMMVKNGGLGKEEELYTMTTLDRILEGKAAFINFPYMVQAFGNICSKIHGYVYFGREISCREIRVSRELRCRGRGLISFNAV